MLYHLIFLVGGIFGLIKTFWNTFGHKFTIGVNVLQNFCLATLTLIVVGFNFLLCGLEIG